MNILQIFKDKISETVKGLTGEDVDIKNGDLCSFEDIKIDESFCIAKTELSGDYGGFISIAFSTHLATSIASFCRSGQTSCNKRFSNGFIVTDMLRSRELMIGEADHGLEVPCTLCSTDRIHLSEVIRCH